MNRASAKQEKVVVPEGGPQIVRIPLNKVKIDPNYQRPRDQKRVERIAADWEDDRSDIAKARLNNDGTYKIRMDVDGTKWLEGTGTVHILNGQHTVTAAQLNGFTHLDMALYMDMDEKRGAIVFAKQVVNRRGVDAYEQFDKLVKGGDANAVKLEGVIYDLGWMRLNPWEYDANGFYAITTAWGIAYGDYKGASALRFETIGKFVNEVWPEDPSRMQGDLLRALNTFFLKYESHPNFDMKRFKSKLGAQPAQNIISEAKQRNQEARKREKMDVQKFLHRIFLEMYDHGARKTLQPREGTEANG